MNFFSNVANSIPVIGHIKGLCHYAAGDTEGGDKAMYQSTRTAAVLGAGAIGSVGGPVVAGAAAMYAGALTDGVASVALKKPQGFIKGCQNIVEDISEGKNPMGSIASTSFQVGMDGLGGVGMGSISGAASQVSETALKQGVENVAKSAVKTIGEKTLQNTIKISGEQVVSSVATAVTKKAIQSVAVQAEIALVSTHVCMQAEENTKEEERERDEEERRRRNREWREREERERREREERERREREEREQREREQREREEREQRDREERQHREREQQAQREREERDRREREQQAQREREERDRREGEQQAQHEREERNRLEREQQAQREREERNRRQREQQAQREREQQAQRAREDQERREREQQGQSSREQQEQPNNSGTNSGDHPRRNTNNNRRPRKAKPDYFAIFMDLLEKTLNIVFNNTETPERNKITEIFAELSEGQIKYLEKIIERLQKGEILEEVLTLVIKIFTENYPEDISFLNFLSLMEFVAVYIQEEIDYRTQVFRMSEEISIEESNGSIIKMNYKDLKATVISSIMDLVNIIEIIVDIFAGLKSDIESELEAFDLSPNFRDIFSAIYHYFKHRCVPGDGLLSVREYYDWIRTVLQELEKQQRYADLLQEQTTQDVKANVVFEIYVVVFGRRIRIVVKFQGIILVLASCFVLDDIHDGDKEGDVWIIIRRL